MVIEEQITRYICSRCGYSVLGKENKERMIKHEKMPITGKCRSLDGLIVSQNENYLVFRMVNQITDQHETLYTHERYNKKTLKRINSPNTLLYDTQTLKKFSPTNNLFRSKPLTADQEIAFCLFLSHQENVYRNYQELSESSFNAVVSRLKKKYPKLYSKLNFNRVLRYKKRN